MLRKPNQREQFRFKREDSGLLVEDTLLHEELVQLSRLLKREDIAGFFPPDYTDQQIRDTVIRLLNQWQKHRQIRNNGAR